MYSVANYHFIVVRKSESNPRVLGRHCAFQLEADTLSIAIVLPCQQEPTRPISTSCRLSEARLRYAAWSGVKICLHETAANSISEHVIDSCTRKLNCEPTIISSELKFRWDVLRKHVLCNVIPSHCKDNVRIRLMMLLQHERLQTHTAINSFNIDLRLPRSNAMEKLLRERVNNFKLLEVVNYFWPVSAYTCNVCYKKRV